MNIVLVEPEIPNNTGNIGRLVLATGTHLHLVRPFGFELSDKRVKRAGLDYWKHVPLTIYDSYGEFDDRIGPSATRAYLSSHAEKNYTEIPFHSDIYLIFGKESVGLSKDIVSDPKNELYTIPLFSPHIRSINLANAVSVVTYEGIRQLGVKS